jgi:hypothetical protein
MLTKPQPRRPLIMKAVAYTAVHLARIIEVQMATTGAVFD